MGRISALIQPTIVMVLIVGMVDCGRIVGSEVHLIPEGYSGPVVILFGVASGKEVRRNEDGAAVYDIPRSGVLWVREEAPASGLYEKRYYFVAPDGTRHQLPHRADPDTLQAFADVVGVTSISERRAVPELRWKTYVVGVPDERSDWEEQRDQAVDRAVSSLLEKNENVSNG